VLKAQYRSESMINDPMGNDFGKDYPVDDRHGLDRGKIGLDFEWIAKLSSLFSN
ncbi:4829_t:CDS:1, partial [Funneliformis caledonium]